MITLFYIAIAYFAIVGAVAGLTVGLTGFFRLMGLKKQAALPSVVESPALGPYRTPGEISPPKEEGDPPTEAVGLFDLPVGTELGEGRADRLARETREADRRLYFRNLTRYQERVERAMEFAVQKGRGSIKLRLFEERAALSKEAPWVRAHKAAVWLANKLEKEGFTATVSAKSHAYEPGFPNKNYVDIQVSWGESPGKEADE